MSGQRARVVRNGVVVSDEPYTPASDYIRECIAAGLCTRCDGKGVTEYWVGTEEHLKCDTCGRRWFRGYPSRQVPLFELESDVSA